MTDLMTPSPFDGRHRPACAGHDPSIFFPQGSDHPAPKRPSGSADAVRWSMNVANTRSSPTNSGSGVAPANACGRRSGFAGFGASGRSVARTACAGRMR